MGCLQVQKGYNFYDPQNGSFFMNRDVYSIMYLRSIKQDTLYPISNYISYDPLSNKTPNLSD